MKTNDVQRVLIVGAGTIGQQIALQCAMHGLSVNLYDIAPAAFESARARLQGYVDELCAAGMLTPESGAAALERIQMTIDPAAAARDVDLVSESVLEDPKIKGDVFSKFNPLCPPHTLFTTNSSTLVPSQYASATGRPAQFCALHFHNPVWHTQIVDVMPHPHTAPETVERVQAFARCIGQTPLLIKKESHAYIFNAMMDGLLSKALGLVAEGVTTYQDVDRSWMGITKMPMGPYGIMDLIGIDLVYEITKRSVGAMAIVPQARRVLDLLKGYVDQGHCGVKNGQGFYTYPHPAFERPGFIEGRAEQDHS